MRTTKPTKLQIERRRVYSILVISTGASFGAILRWILGSSLNALFPVLPPGTLLANWVGGYLMGIAIAVFSNHPVLAPEWRLLIITGFLGGLTTFSAFSAEVTHLIQHRQLLWASVAISAHVVGSLIMTLLGIATVTTMTQC